MKTANNLLLLFILVFIFGCEKENVVGTKEGNTAIKITIITPNGNERFDKNGAITINWLNSNISGEVNIYLFKNNSLNDTIVKNLINNGSFEWKLSDKILNDSDYKIKVISVNNPNINDYSDNNFTITDGHVWTSNINAVSDFLYITSDGKNIISIDVNRNIKILDAGSGSILWTINAGFNTSFGLSANGNKIYVNNLQTKNIKIWDTFTGSLLWSINYTTSASILFSHDANKLIVSEYRTNYFKVYNAITGITLWTGNHDNFVTSVKFNIDDKKIVSTSDDKILKVWNCNTGNIIWSRNNSGKYAFFDESNTRIISFTTMIDSSIIILSEINGELSQSLNNNRAISTVYQYCGSNKILSKGVDNEFKMWDLNTATILWKSLNNFDYAYFNQDRSKLGVYRQLSGDSTIKILNANTGVTLWSRILSRIRISNYTTYSSFYFIWDGNTFACGSFDNSIKLLDANIGSTKWVGDNNGVVTDIWYCPDGKSFFTASTDSTIKMWKPAFNLSSSHSTQRPNTYQIKMYNF